MKALERQLEFIEIQEEYVKDEQKNLKRELLHAQEEVKRIQAVPLLIGQFLEMIDQHHGIVGSTAGSNYFVRILSTINRELLKPNTSVALHRHSHALVDVLPPESDSSIQVLSSSERPDVTYQDVGGLDLQKQEIREAVELPLTHPELYSQVFTITGTRPYNSIPQFLIGAHCLHRLVLIRPEVYFCMEHLVQARQCLRKLLHIILLQRSFVW